MAWTFLASLCTALATLSLFEYGLAATSTPNVLSLDFTKRTSVENHGLQRRKDFGPVVPVSSDVYLGKDVFYHINITIGTPPQNSSVLLDTGSSDLWVLAKDAETCQPNPAINCSQGTFDSSASSTFKEVIKNGFNITYLLLNQDLGDIVNDTVGVGGVSVTSSFGLVHKGGDKMYKLPGDKTGVMGVSFPVSESTIESANYKYNNFVDLLYLQGTIAYKAFSLWVDDINASTGTILFGGIDTSKYTGDLIAMPIQPNAYSGIISSFDLAATSISFQADSKSSPVLLTSSDAVFQVTLDSGTPGMSLPDEIVAEIFHGLGAVIADLPTHLAFVACSWSKTDATLNFGLGGKGGANIAVPIAEFIIPFLDTADSEYLDPVTKAPICQLTINMGGSGPFLYGDPFLRAAYVVYDLENEQIALAQANFDPSDSKIETIGTSGLPGVKTTVTGGPAATATLTSYVGAQSSAAISKADASSLAATVLTSATFPLSSGSARQTVAGSTSVAASTTADSTNSASMLASATSSAQSTSSASASAKGNAAAVLSGPGEGTNGVIALLVTFCIGLMM